MNIILHLAYLGVFAIIIFVGIYFQLGPSFLIGVAIGIIVSMTFEKLESSKKETKNRFRK